MKEERGRRDTGRDEGSEVGKKGGRKEWREVGREGGRDGGEEREREAIVTHSNLVATCHLDSKSPVHVVVTCSYLQAP